MAEARWNDPVAVTLTLKQAILSEGIWVRIDDIQATAALRHAMSIADRKIYGNQVRNGKRLQTFAVYEGSKATRYHFHLLLDLPEHVSLEVLAARIKAAWQKTLWGYEISSFKKCDMGWANYITKLSTKEDFASNIDWENIVIPLSV